jgi:hypothetical protein
VADGGEVALNRAHISKTRQRALKTEVAGGGEMAPAKQDCLQGHLNVVQCHNGVKQGWGG